MVWNLFPIKVHTISILWIFKFFSAAGPFEMSVYTTFGTAWIKQVTVPSILSVLGPCITKYCRQPQTGKNGSGACFIRALPKIDRNV